MDRLFINNVLKSIFVLLSMYCSANPQVRQKSFDDVQRFDMLAKDDDHRLPPVHSINLPTPKPLIDKHQTIEVLCFCFFPEGLDKKAVIPHCLKDINSAGLH